MAASRPGNTERGWNDPPMFFYSAQSSVQKSPSKSPLHKRVAHPGVSTPSTTGGTTASASPLLMPPTKSVESNLMTPTPVDHSVQSSSSPSTAESSSSISGVDLSHFNLSNDEQTLDHVMGRLNNVIEDCSKVIQKRIVDDVNKKLLIMKNSWLKTSQPVKLRMAALATALDKRDCDKAHEIHLSLMVDYISEVSQWMVGVKRLILEARKVPNPKIETTEIQTEDKTDAETTKDNKDLTSKNSSCNVTDINILNPAEIQSDEQMPENTDDISSDSTKIESQTEADETANCDKTNTGENIDH